MPESTKPSVDVLERELDPNKFGEIVGIGAKIQLCTEPDGEEKSAFGAAVVWTKGKNNADTQKRHRIHIALRLTRHLGAHLRNGTLLCNGGSILQNYIIHKKNGGGQIWLERK